MNLLRDEYKEHLRQKVIEAHRLVEECIMARVRHYDNPYLKLAMDQALDQAAELHYRFLEKYGEEPFMPVEMEEVS